jgi:hypothetical protein
MKALEFIIEGSQGDEHRVVFEKNGAELHAFCSCLAGDNGIYCKHRFALMDGSVDALLSENETDLMTLQAWMTGTKLEAAYQRVTKAVKALKRAKDECNAAKKVLAQVMYR